MSSAEVLILPSSDYRNPALFVLFCFVFLRVRHKQFHGPQSEIKGLVTDSEKKLVVAKPLNYDFSFRLF